MDSQRENNRIIKQILETSKSEESRKDILKCFIQNEPISWVSYFINGFLTTFFVLFGLCGIIYYRKSTTETKPSRMNIFLKALCLWDALLLLSAFGMYGALVLLWGRRPWYGPEVYCHVIFYPAIHITISGCAWTLVTLTYDRYRAVSDPLKQMTRGSSKARLICVFVFFFAFILNVPATMELQTEHCSDPITQQISTTIYYSKLTTSKWFKFGYKIFGYSTLMLVLPIILVSIITVKTLTIRRAAMVKRSSGTSNSGWDRMKTQRTLLNATTVLTAICIKFFLCYTLPTVCTLMQALEIMPTSSESIKLLTDIGHLLVVINSSTNWCQLYGLRSISKRRTERLKHKRRGVSLCDKDTRVLVRLWSKVNAFQVATELIPIFEQIFVQCQNKKESSMSRIARLKWLVKITLKPSQICVTCWRRFMQISGSTNNTERSPSPCRSNSQAITQDHTCAAKKMGKFLNQVVADLPLFKTVDIRENIRQIGLEHFNRNIDLRRIDWFLIRGAMIEKIVEHMECLPEERTAAEKLVNLIIREMKIGFVCQALDENKHTPLSIRHSSNVCSSLATNSDADGRSDNNSNYFIHSIL